MRSNFKNQLAVLELKIHLPWPSAGFFSEIRCLYRCGACVWSSSARNDDGEQASMYDKNWKITRLAANREMMNEPTQQTNECWANYLTKCVDYHFWCFFLSILILRSHSIRFNVHCFYSYCRTIDELRLIHSLICETKWTTCAQRESHLIKSELRQRQNRKWIKKRNSKIIQMSSLNHRLS